MAWSATTRARRSNGSSGQTSISPVANLRSAKGFTVRSGQYFIADLFPTVPPALNGLNDKPVMSKPAQLAKLIELRKDLRRES
jgi:hypothetical protein